MGVPANQAGWGAANSVTRIIASGSTTFGNVATTFVSNVTRADTAVTIVNNMTASSTTGIVGRSATLWSTASVTLPSSTQIAASIDAHADTPAAAATSHRHNFSSLLAELLARRADLANWYQSDGDRPSEGAFGDAETFIGLIPSGAPLPSLYVSGDAEVGFSWMWDEGFIEVAFRGDGNIRYAFRFGEDLKGDVCEFRPAQVPLVPVLLMTALNALITDKEGVSCKYSTQPG